MSGDERNEYLARVADLPTKRYADRAEIPLKKPFLIRFSDQSLKIYAMGLDSFRVRMCFHFTVAFATAMFGMKSFLLAQTEKPETTGNNLPAAESTPSNDFRFSVVRLSTGGSYVYVPEKWGELHFSVTNVREEPREMICATSFEDQPQLQFGRRIWVPARSTLRLSHPFVIPKYDASRGRVLNLNTVVLDASEKDEVFLKNESGKNLHDGALFVTHSAHITGLINSMGEEKDQLPIAVSELIQAGRVSQQLTNQVVSMLDQFLPADASGLNCFNQIVIADNRITDDFAALAALRHWLHEGGHLWVMLDLADPIVLERLLGDEFSGQILDRVGLTSVRVDRAPTLYDVGVTTGETVEYEEPVDLVRMVSSKFDVVNRVNGWPALMTKTIGEGKVYMTTLGPRGWMKPVPPNTTQSPDPSKTSRFTVTQPMNEFATDFFSKREPELLPQTALEPQVREYVGYSIPSWNVIVGALFGFAILLLALGLLLLRMGRLEHLGWIGSLMAIAVSVLLLSIGRAHRHGIPGTVASVQLVQAIKGTDDTRIQGLVAVYQPEGTRSEIKVNGGGRMMPDMTGLENVTRRMVSTDLGEWYWENLAQPAGLRAAEFNRAETVADRIEAHATFNENGLVGTYSGRLAAGTDALIATRSGRLAVTFDGPRNFVARANNLFEKDQYLSADLVSDEQDRRRRTFEKLLANPKRTDYPVYPQLMFWSDQWEHGVEFGDGLKRQGSTLVAVPLSIDRPVNGTKFLIPSPLLTYRNRTQPNGLPNSTMWSYGRKEWQECSTPGSSWLRFQIPRELLPLTANQARIDVKVTGPIGRIELKGLKNGETTSLRTIIDPVGAFSIDVIDSEVLSIDEDGGVSLGLYAGDPARPELTHSSGKPAVNGTGQAAGDANRNTKVNYWRIESLTMQLWVTATEPTARAEK